MTKYLWDLEQFAAVCDAVRAQTGKTGQLKMSELPDEIASISGGSEIWRECWLEKPLDAPQTLFIELPLYGYNKDIIDVTCRAFPGKMAAPFNSTKTSGERQGFNILSESNKLQVYWGNYSDTNVILDRGTQIDLNQTITVTQSRDGISISGCTKNGGEGRFSINHTSQGAAYDTQETYKIFHYARNTDIHHGLFRRAQILRRTSYEIIDIVPEISSNFTARIRITSDSGEEQYVPVPHGFICHVDNESAT